MFNFLFRQKSKFKSDNYWEERYKAGGNSGAGSYNHLANWKAEIINDLIEKYHLHRILEFGCGDGNQASLLQCEQYIGLDVSLSAIEICKSKFVNDESKSFFLYHGSAFIDNSKIFLCDATLSLDVLYHLVEDDVYDSYLNHLFESSSNLVVIYAANVNLAQTNNHELYRKFTNDIERKFPMWKLKEHIKNKFPAKDYNDQEGSLADFFIYSFRES